MTDGTLAVGTSGQPQPNADGTGTGTEGVKEQPAGGTGEQPVDEAAKAAAAKAEADKKAAEDKAAADEKAKQEAEAKRAENFGAPKEGYEFKAEKDRTEIDPAIKDELVAIAKELDLSGKAAQKLHDLGVKVADKQIERIGAQIEKTKADWMVQSKSDKEFGGDQLDANLAVARKTLETYGTPELKTLLNDSGLGNHPEVIRWMYRVGKTLQQDTHVGGGQGGGAVKTPQSFYNNSKMQP